MARRCLLFLVVLAAMAGPRPAAADDTHLSGLELMLRPALGAGSAQSPVRYQARAGVTGIDPGALLTGASPYGVGFVGQGFIGYRFHPVISAGLRAGLRTSSASGLNDGSSDLARSAWDAGLYVRGYPLALNEKVRRHLDPWLSVGVEYMRDQQTFQRPVRSSAGGSVKADWTLDHHAIAVPISLGVDYRVLSMLSIGPSFEYAIALGQAACTKVGASGYSSNEYCTDKDPGKQFLKAKTYGVWSIGLDLKLTLF
jgi:hypothetical protein